MSILNELEKKTIALASKTPLIKDNFWLVGGTTLAEFYLQHRLSEDIDFFTDNRDIFRGAMSDFESAADKEGFRIEIKKMGDTFARIVATVNDKSIKLEFAVDAGFRYGPPVLSPYGMRIENKVDISCNKMSALYDRFEPKDFVDVYFIHNELFKLDDLIPWTKEKHGGFDNYMLSISLKQVTNITHLPKMLKHLEPKEMEKFFLEYAARLVKEPFDARPYGK